MDFADAAIENVVNVFVAGLFDGLLMRCEGALTACWVLPGEARPTSGWGGGGGGGLGFFDAVFDMGWDADAADLVAMSWWKKAAWWC